MNNPQNPQQPPEDPVYNVQHLFDPLGRRIMRAACIKHAFARLSIIKDHLRAEVDAVSEDFSEYLYENLGRTYFMMESSEPDDLLKRAFQAAHRVPLDLNQLENELTTIMIGSGSQMEELFSASPTGVKLRQAWKALIDSDLQTLVQMVPLAPNSLVYDNLADKMFRHLLECAGIAVSSVYEGRFVFMSPLDSPQNAEYEKSGSLVLLSGNSGIKLSYRRKAGRSSPDTFSIAAVQGTIKSSFQESAPSNQDPQAIMAAATTIAQHLRAHYGGNKTP